MNNGVIYIVLNDRVLLDEAIYSARTIKKHSPGIKLCIFTNLNLSESQSKNFHFLIPNNENLHPLKLKVKLLPTSPFEKTLFLDADTAVLTNIDELFNLLDKVSLAFTYDNLCDWRQSPPLFLAQESADINTGFLLYRKNSDSLKYFDLWFDKIRNQNEQEMRPGTNCDQVYFNKFVFPELKNCSSIFNILSNEVYNVRPWCWSSLKEKGKWDKIKILHAHHLHWTFFDKLKNKALNLFK